MIGGTREAAGFAGAKNYLLDLREAVRAKD